MARARKKTAGKKKDVSTMPKKEVLRYLFDLGYFNEKTWAAVQKISDAELKRAVKAYQKFNGLAPGGVVDDVTAHWISRRRCGLPDFGLTAAGRTCKWPMKEISYYHEITMPGLTEHQVAEAYDVAFSQWAEICDIEPQRVETASHANIFARSGSGRSANLDGRGGTLAWSELPCGVTPNVQLDQMFDEAEPWSFNMAVAVICHELGHALGLGHLNAGNLMAPYYDPNLTAPQAGDIEEMVKLYGQRKTRYAITKDAGLQIGGTLLINGRPFVLVPQT